MIKPAKRETTVVRLLSHTPPLQRYPPTTPTTHHPPATLPIRNTQPPQPFLLPPQSRRPLQLLPMLLSRPQTTLLSLLEQPLTLALQHLLARVGQAQSLISNVLDYMLSQNNKGGKPPSATNKGAPDIPMGAVPQLTLPQ